MAPFQTPMEHYLLSPLLHLLVALIPDLHSGSGGSVDKLCPTLWSLLGSSVHGILLARILESVTMSFSRGSSRPRDQTLFSYIAGGFFTD